MKKRLVHWCIVLLLGVTACTAQSPSTPSSSTITPPQPTMALALAPTGTLAPPVVITATQPTTVIFIGGAPIQDAPLPPQPTPADVIGGGTVKDGPFVFDLRLFQDPSFGQQPVAASLYSDLNGIGAYLWWVYQGPEATGPVQTYWGTVPHLDQLDQATFPSVKKGSRGGRTGGVLLPGGLFLPGESKPGDRIQMALKVHTPNGDSGAVLHFILNHDANGFKPADISVDVLPPGG